MKKILYLGLNPPEDQTSVLFTPCPIIQIIPHNPDHADIVSGFSDIPRYTHYLFTSKTAVQIFFKYLPLFGYDSAAICDKQCLAVGQSTARYLIPFRENNVAFERVKAPGFNDRNWVHIINIDPVTIVESRELSRSSNTTLFSLNGIRHPLVATTETAEGVVALLDSLLLDNAYLFWPHSALARPVIKTYLDARRIAYKDAALYTTVPRRPERVPNFDMYDEIYFTSPSTVDAFKQFFGRPPSHITLTPIGPITKEHLKKCLG